MRRWIVALGLLVAALAMLDPMGLAAQQKAKPLAAWDGPDFMAPGPESLLGAYYIRPRDTDGGVAVTWRSGGSLVLGVRGEYVHDPFFGPLWGIGGEAKGGIGPVAPPLAINWTAGIGAIINPSSDVSGGEADLRLPVGLSLGLRLVSGDLVLTPYVHPRVSLAVVSFNGGGTDTSVEFDTDVGLDLQLTKGLLLRAGGTFGDQGPTYGAGLAVNLGGF